MRKTTLEILTCPKCQDGDLSLEASKEEGEEILDGTLHCQKCDTRYPIEGGIPNFLLGKHVKIVQSAFSKMWSMRFAGKFEKNNVVYLYDHDDMVDETESYLGGDDYLKKIQEGEWALEAGCGSGDKAAVFAKRNPHLRVVAMDFSTSINTVRENFKHIPNLDFVRGDVNHPPFKSESIKVVISIGVLHTTESTERAFDAMSRVVAKGGKFHIWLYPDKSEGGKTWRLFYFIRDVMYLGIGHHLPPFFIYWSLRGLFLWTLFLPKSQRPQGHGNKLSAFDYYRGIVFTLYDDVCPKYQHRHKKEEVLGWYRARGFVEESSPNLGFFVGMKPTS